RFLVIFVAVPAVLGSGCASRFFNSPSRNGRTVGIAAYQRIPSATKNSTDLALLGPDGEIRGVFSSLRPAPGEWGYRLTSGGRLVFEILFRRNEPGFEVRDSSNRVGRMRYVAGKLQPDNDASRSLLAQNAEHVRTISAIAQDMMGLPVGCSSDGYCAPEFASCTDCSGGGGGGPLGGAAGGGGGGGGGGTPP